MHVHVYRRDNKFGGVYEKRTFSGSWALIVLLCVCGGGCLLATLPYSRQTERNVMKSNEAYI